MKKTSARPSSPEFVSPGQWLRFMLSKILGCVIILLGIVMAVTLLGYQPGDVSGNHWVSSVNPPENIPVENMMGETGAFFSDWAWQIFGLTSFVFPIFVLGWGWNFLRCQRISWWGLRIAVLMLSVVVLAVVCSHPAMPKWGHLKLHGWGGGLGAALHPMIADRLMPVLKQYSNMMFVFWGGMAGLSLWGVVWASLFPWSAPRWVMVRLWNIARWVYLRVAKNMVSTKQRIMRSKQEPLSGLPSSLPIRFDISDRLFPKMDQDEMRLQREPVIKTKRAKQLTRQFHDIEPDRKQIKPEQKSLDFFNPTVNHNFVLPPLKLMDKPKTLNDKVQHHPQQLAETSRRLKDVLKDFGVQGDITQVSPGPVVTLYELEPAPGTKTSRIINLSEDIARSMSALSVRSAVVPGRNVIGIEIPNNKRETVFLYELLGSEAYSQTPTKLPIILGKDIGGAPVIVDLAKMPHLLVAGTTGSGKSVSINVMILSLLFKLRPDQCRMIMIDPKMLELSVYEGIPHLLSPVVTDPKKAIVALKWVVREMERRYQAMSKFGVRNILGYNQKILEALAHGGTHNHRIHTGFDPITGKAVYEEHPMELKTLPYIVVVVDEMADLMLVAGKDIEGAIQRLAQMARAAGIHLILATQRPSVDVITGTIKANFPCRVSFQVTSKIDSRTILGEQGAEQLLGMGDMLYMASGGRITRVHGAFVSDDDVEHVVSHLKEQGEPEYVSNVTEEDDEQGHDMLGGGDGNDQDLYRRAISIVVREKKASTSFIQRQLQIGYNRAANLIERMEKEGIVSPANHVGKREILIQ